MVHTRTVTAAHNDGLPSGRMGGVANFARIADRAIVSPAGNRSLAGTGGCDSGHDVGSLGVNEHGRTGLPQHELLPNRRLRRANGST